MIFKLARMALAVLALVPASALATEFEVRLRCTGIPFDDLRVVEVVEDMNDLIGAVRVVEHRASGGTRYWMIDPADLTRRQIPLSSWNGYTRTLERSESGEWVISHRDECSGGFSPVRCIENP